MSETLHDIYHAQAAAGALTPDPAQEAVLPMLEDIRHHLEATHLKRKGILGGLFHKPEEVPQGLYLWGGVGRGKSMLMDLFVGELNIGRKRRVHFHAFMQEVHAGMHKARQDQAGVVVVTTSNRPPDDLYKDGLNRQLFLPFIDLIHEQLVVHELASPQDYRQDKLAGSQTYFTPLGRAAREGVEAIWQRFAAGGDVRPLVLNVKRREVELPAFCSGVARASFYDLCAKPLGAADYLAIADRVRVLILDDIPALSRANFNEARRFVVLIDALYEAHVRLVASAAAEPESLYLEGEGSFE
ncbi:MAG: cell division protein ZapE, partial [Maritimibacter sp.]